MADEERPPDTFREPARDLPVIGTPDVLVVGGGSAGIAAAVAAARSGADTWLVEGSTTLGGLATFGLINLLLTLDDGAGNQVVAGLCQETVDRLAARGAAHFPEPAAWNVEDPAAVDHWRQWGLIWGFPEAVRYSVAFDPESFVDVALDLLGAAGVRLRFMTWFAAAHMVDDRIDAVVVESKSGRQAIRPAVVVDATGDGDVFAAAGAAFEQVAVPPYLWFRAGGVDTSAAMAGGIWFRTTGDGRVLVPWGPDGERVDACDAEQLSDALVRCRIGARAEFQRLRRDVPAFASAYLDDYARFLGVTESRRLVGDHVLTKEEGDATFPDTVARTGHWTRRGVVFEVPYGALKTQAVANLLVAGRCISTTRYVHQATKEIPAAMATGEAAGVAAAMAAPRGDVHAVDIEWLRATLAAAGADVGPR